MSPPAGVDRICWTTRAKLSWTSEWNWLLIQLILNKYTKGLPYLGPGHCVIPACGRWDMKPTIKQIVLLVSEDKPNMSMSPSRAVSFLQEPPFISPQPQCVRGEGGVCLISSDCSPPASPGVIEQENIHRQWNVTSLRWAFSWWGLVISTWQMQLLNVISF